MNYNLFKILKKILPLLIVFLLASCEKEEIPTEITPPPPIPQANISYLALGDSYTIGQGVSEAERWPNQLGDELTELDYTIDAIDIIAQTGWTTSRLLQEMDNSTIGDYNLVSLLIGVNNQYQNKSFVVFQAEFNVLLDRSIEIAGDSTRVFVVSIPDYGVTPFGSSNSEQIGQELDMYNEYMATQCADKNIPFVNITEISRELGDSDGALASDNLHPSGSQYAAWVNEILPIVIDILGE